MSSARKLALSAAVILFIYNLAPLALGTDGLVERVPDDAFYYLVLCKNFVEKGFWTFDGQSVASGFHILFGYLIAGIYAVAPSIGLEAMYGVVVLLNTALVAGAVYLLARTNDSMDLSRGNLALLLVAISSVGLRLPGFPMESSLVIFFSACAFYLASRAGASRTQFGAGVVVGVLGVLSRSDWGLLPFALLAGAIAHMWWRGEWERPVLMTIAALCLGALIGEAVVAWHTYHFTGGFVQRSASIKHFWASVQGYTPLPGVARVVELASPYVIPRPVMLVILMGLAVIMAWKKVLGALLDNRLVLSSLMMIGGYWAVYTLNGSVQYWYAATFFAAVACVASAAFALVPEGKGPEGPGHVRLALVALFIASGAYQFANPPWTWAPAMVEAGRFLQSEPKYAPVGAWNAGIISYFSGRSVTNLDGLVNDDVYPAVVGGKLADYVRDRNISYIIDFPTAFTLGAEKGGLADGRLARCKTPVRTFRDDLEFDVGSLTLFKIDATCLSK